MSGHSKWSTIKHKKGAADAKRGKVFSRYSKELSVLARDGKDPDKNPALKMMIDRARKENMPKSTIDRAIKKGAGELPGVGPLVTAIYGGLGPGQVIYLVECLTDNKNRTAPVIKTIFNKNGGQFRDLDSLLWQFDQRGIIEVEVAVEQIDELLLELIDLGILDSVVLDSGLRVITSVSDLKKVTSYLLDQKYQVVLSELRYLPKEKVELTEVDRPKNEKLISLLEDDPDVIKVTLNYE